MKNIMKTIVTIMVMAMVITGFTPTVAGAKGKTSITVVNKTTGKKMSKKNTLKVGQKLQLKVKSGKKDVTKKAKYKASNKNVKVSKSGKITAKKAGSCKVTIKYGKKSKNVIFAVKANTSKPSTKDIYDIRLIQKDEGFVALYACDDSQTPIYKLDETPYKEFYKDGKLQLDVVASHIVCELPNGCDGDSSCNHHYVYSLWTYNGTKVFGGTKSYVCTKCCKRK